MLGHCESGVLSADWQDAVCCLAYFVLAEVKWTTTHAWALLSPPGALGLLGLLCCPFVRACYPAFSSYLVLGLLNSSCD